MAAAATGLKRFYLVLGVVALVGIAALVYLVRQPKGVSIPANVTVLAADTAGFRGYLLGSDSAVLEVSEYADYECPACQNFETIQFPAVRDQLIATGKVRWRYRDFPLEMHPNARVAAHAAACAEEQGKYWELHAGLYERQGEWALSRKASGKFRELADALGMDRKRFDDCMSSAKYAGRIQASLEEGIRLGVGSTPTFLIGGRLFPGVLTSDSLRMMVEQAIPPRTP
ncbi:MAG TPA: thioredoxin domain-containing protein [Gemmatimonadales bacterium]|jgi:protein-disulfide isomerase|nr:thioredoxin domain-containing protein [Gemmatimonadales bacterium]